MAEDRGNSSRRGRSGLARAPRLISRVSKGPKADVSDSRSQERRAQIMEAAIKVFAHKGYHKCRVSDIATEAGIAYGLVYHYYENKEDILISIFREHWAVFVKLLESIASDAETPIDAKLLQIVTVLLESYRQRPQLTEVIVLELLHAPEFRRPELVNLFEAAFKLVEKIVDDAKARGQLRGDINARVFSYLLLGGIETVMTGLTIRKLTFGAEEFAALAQQITRLYLDSMRT